MSQLRVSVYDLLGWVTHTSLFVFVGGGVICCEGKVREGSNFFGFCEGYLVGSGGWEEEEEEVTSLVMR